MTYDASDNMASVYERHRDNFDVKAFHWGSLTAGRSVTALWILLSPFALANAAGWMTDRPNLWTRTFCRLAALSLTCLFFVQVSHMALDIPYDALVRGVDDPPLVAVVSMYAGLTSILILILVALGTQSHFRDYSFVTKLTLVFHPAPIRMLPPEYWEATTPPPAQWLDPANGVTLAGPTMWQTHGILQRLTRLHIAAGLAALTLVVAWGMESPGLVKGALAMFLILVLLMALTTTAPDWVPLHYLTAIAPLAGLGLSLWGIAVIVRGPLTDTSLSMSGELTFIFAVTLGFMALLALSGEWFVSRRLGWKAVSKGLKTVGMLAIGAFIGASLGLTGALVVEDLTGGAADGDSRVLEQGGAWTSVAMLGMVVLLLTVGLILARRPLALSQPNQTVPDNEIAPESPLRRVLLRAPWLFGSAGAYGLLMGIIAVVSACDIGWPLSCDSGALPDWDLVWGDWGVTFFGLTFQLGSLTGWAKLLMVVVPAVFIFRSIIGGLLRGQDSRRQVSILWDIGSFWNRWYHPLGPPAYSPYAVRELDDVLGSRRPEILAAHSQGSLIAAVAIARLDATKSAPHFLTYGSQLGGLYTTMFPSVGIDELIDIVKERVDGMWINLWRRSDGIGGQVISELGAANWHVDSGSGHSRYELTPEFCEARVSLLSGSTVRPRQQQLVDCWDRTTTRGTASQGPTTVLP